MTEPAKLYFARMRPEARLPKKREEDAGYDFYACFKEESMDFKPLETRLVPLGIASAFDSDYVLLLKERGSTGIKNLSLRAGVIDSGFRGEYLAAITNLNPKPLRIMKEKAYSKLSEKEKEDFVCYPYEKAICQGIFLELPKAQVKEISLEELEAIPSLRGRGLLGSSGK